MAYEADRVVVELIAKTEGFDGKVKQSATTFKAATKSVEQDAITMTAAQFRAAGGADGLARSFEKIEPAAKKAERGIRAAQQSTRNLGFQISDISTQISMGTSPFLILAQQGPQVANALDGAKGKLGAFATFLSGPWGAALLGAVTVFGVFITRHKEAGNSVDDLVEKLKESAEKTESARRAQEIYGSTLEGVTEALNDLDKIQKQLNDSTKTTAQLALQGATAAKLRLDNIRTETLALIDQAEAQLAVTRAQAQTSGSMRDSGAAAEQREVEGRLDALRKRVESTNTQIARAQQKIAEFSSRMAVEIGERMSDPVERVKKKYDDLIEATRRRLMGEKEATKEIARQTALLIKQRDAEIEALRKRKQGSGESGKQISFADAAAIARGAGLTVTSAQRSTAKQAALFNDPNVNRPGNPVARPGTSAHEGVNGKWALDIAFAPGLSAQSLKKLYGDQGVSLSAVYKEKGHFHIEGSRSQAAAQEREAERQRKEAQRLAEQEMRRVQAFINEKAGLEDQVLDARQALATNAGDVAKIEEMVVEAARQKYEQNVKALQEQGRLLPAEAAELIKLNDERAKLRQELVKRREAEKAFREQEARNQQTLAVQSAGFEAQAEVLQGQEQLARTAKERREIEQRLLDLQFAEEKMRLQYQIAYAERLQTQEGISESEKAEAAAQAAIARMKLQTIDQRHAQATEGNNRSNAGPIKSYLDSIPQTAAEIDAALEQVAANGLASLADGIATAVANFESLGDVARSVLQQLTQMLIRMVLQQLILKAFSFIGLSTGGPVPGKAAGGVIRGFAPGGYISGPGGPTSDSIPIMASDGEYMIQQRSARKIGYHALDYLNRTGELPPHFASGGEIRRVQPMNVAAAPPGRALTSADVHEFRSIVGDAVRAGLQAMPDVNLYASLDPADMFQRALGTPAGHRALLAHLGANSGAVRSAIR